MTATSDDDITALELMLKTRFGHRHLNSVGQLIHEQLGTVADMEWILHATQWDRLWADYVAVYNPIWNVDGTEVTEEERDLTQTDTGSDTYTDSGSDTTTKTGNDTVTSEGTTTTEGDIYGIDSVDGAPANKTTVTPDLTDETTYNTTTELEHGKVTTNDKDLTHTDAGTVTVTKTRTGNIGVTKTQELLTADQEFWQNAKSMFYEHVVLQIVDDITYKINVD